ncbi:MAG: hypothetical protein ACRED8_08980, partial [Caulobacteraceae bacterium]
MAAAPENGPVPREIFDLDIAPKAPLLVLDVDEVLAMFMRGFERFVGGRGYEMRITRFAIFQNIYRPGEAEHIDVAAGRELFDHFFATNVEEIDPAPGAAEAVAAIAKEAAVVILSNAPAGCREARARWLERSGFPYPLVVNTGLKG